MNQSLCEIDQNKISVNALKVVHRLLEHGYQAYLVGGCIRDLLLDRSPKDFDVATDAHPDDVREIFRNSRIIGKRFRIVHVRFGREIVEVTTFRGPHDAEYNNNHSDAGMTLSDNIYGTFEEDVFRRDFAMNAIYYQPQSLEIIDLASGIDDISNKTITTIGDPESRFREDPVRMLRALRFKAKLGFQIEAAGESAIRTLGHLIQDVAPARLFEEVLKLYMSGYALNAFDAMLDCDIFDWMFPDARREKENLLADELIRLALTSTDRRIQADQPVTPAFIFAAIFWYPFVAEKDRLIEAGCNAFDASNDAANNIIGKQQHFTSIPKRFSGPMRDIWFLQAKLPIRFGRKPDVLLEHKRFRAAYDFLLLRELAGEQTDGLGAWWTEYQTADEARREEMKLPPSQEKKRKRKRRHSRKPKDRDTTTTDANKQISG